LFSTENLRLASILVVVVLVSTFCYVTTDTCFVGGWEKETCNNTCCCTFNSTGSNYTSTACVTQAVCTVIKGQCASSLDGECLVGSGSDQTCSSDTCCCSFDIARDNVQYTDTVCISEAACKYENGTCATTKLIA